MDQYFVGLENYDPALWPDASFWADSNMTNSNSTMSTSSSLPPWRGTNGMISTMPAGPAIDAVAPLFVQSGLNSGIPLAVQGFNGPNTADRNGVGYYEFNILNGVRNSVAESMLGGMNPEARAIPSNLEVQTGATVTRLLFGPGSNHTHAAVGVEVQPAIPGGSPTLYMLKPSDPNAEVILAAGAVMTPQILYNLGIAENGNVANVTGVGKHLVDQPAVPIAFELSPSLAQQAPSLYTMSLAMENYFISVDELNIVESQKRLALWNATQSAGLPTYAGAKTSGRTTTTTGIWPSSSNTGTNSSGNKTAPSNTTSSTSTTTSSTTASILNASRTKLFAEAQGLGTMATAGFAAGAFIRSPYAVSPEADLQLTVFPRVLEPHVIRLEKQHKKFLANLTQDLNAPAMLVTVTLLKPQGEYVVNFAPKPSVTAGQFQPPGFALPANRSTYLTDLDVRRLAWGVNQVRRILGTAPLSTQTGLEVLPGTSVNGTVLDEYIHASHLRNAYWVGSCQMGTGPEAVVDENVKVKGVQQLRVVDASIFPTTPNGNTHASVVAVASRATDLIWGGRT